MKTLMKLFKLFLMLLVVSGLLSGCGKKEDTKVIQSVSELNGRDMGCMSGSIFDALIAEQFPDSKIVYYTSRSELLLGLTSGKIDGFISDEPVAMMMKNQNPGVDYLEEAVGEVEYGICFSEANLDKRSEFNEFLAKIKESGKL